MRVVVSGQLQCGLNFPGLFPFCDKHRSRLAALLSLHPLQVQNVVGVEICGIAYDQIFEHGLRFFELAHAKHRRRHLSPQRLIALHLPARIIEQEDCLFRAMTLHEHLCQNAVSVGVCGPTATQFFPERLHFAQQNGGSSRIGKIDLVAGIGKQLYQTFLCWRELHRPDQRFPCGRQFAHLQTEPGYRRVGGCIPGVLLDGTPVVKHGGGNLSFTLRACSFCAQLRSPGEHFRATRTQKHQQERYRRRGLGPGAGYTLLSAFIRYKAGQHLEARPVLQVPAMQYFRLPQNDCEASQYSSSEPQQARQKNAHPPSRENGSRRQRGRFQHFNTFTLAAPFHLGGSARFLMLFHQTFVVLFGTFILTPGYEQLHFLPGGCALLLAQPLRFGPQFAFFADLFTGFFVDRLQLQLRQRNSGGVSFEVPILQAHGSFFLKALGRLLHFPHIVLRRDYIGKTFPVTLLEPFQPAL